MSDPAREMQQLRAQAKALRDELATARDGRQDLANRIADAHRDVVASQAKADLVQNNVTNWTKEAAANRAKADDYDKESRRATFEGRDHDAEQLREQAVAERANATGTERLVQREADQAKQFADEHARLASQESDLRKEFADKDAHLSKADSAIDGIEDKARHLENSVNLDKQADDFQQQAEAARAKGDDTEADRLVGEATTARISAAASRDMAADTTVDDQAIKDAGLTVPADTSDPNALMDPNDPDDFDNATSSNAVPATDDQNVAAAANANADSDANGTADDTAQVPNAEDQASDTGADPNVPSTDLGITADTTDDSAQTGGSYDAPAPDDSDGQGDVSGLDTSYTDPTSDSDQTYNDDSNAPQDSSGGGYDDSNYSSSDNSGGYADAGSADDGSGAETQDLEADPV